ncbi:diaminopimelate decarboxylase family protein [Streptosporangium sp. CA-115845]|uniref:diaminopimelate decarboxylase family protein n=1 Tax=Streptosporangium sp. CA-115845 TaxID=3240071 RepID=UPI003D8B8BFB
MTVSDLSHAPEALAHAPDGSVTFDGVDLAQLAAGHGTPTWVISAAQLRHNYMALHTALSARLPRPVIAYSMKANNNRTVVQTMAGLGAVLDCSSEHELALAVSAGVPAGRVIVNGNGKSRAYLTAAIRMGVWQINVDSIAEVGRIRSIARELGVSVPCAVRLKLSYTRLLQNDPSYERTLRVAEGKFGSSTQSGDAEAVVKAILAAEELEFVGLTHHAGFPGIRADYTAERQLMHQTLCAQEIVEFAHLLRRGMGVTVPRINLGGGFRSGGSVYLSTPGDGTDGEFRALPRPEEYAEAIAAGLAQADWDPIVQFETGGFQVGNAVLLLARVQDTKDVTHPRERRYVTLDCAMTMFTGRGLTRVGFPVIAVGHPPDAPVHPLPVELVGPTCAYDSIAEDLLLPDVREGDLVALLNHGAYCEVLSTQFNGFPRPAVVYLDGGDVRPARRRETLADVWERESAALDLWPGGGTA